MSSRAQQELPLLLSLAHDRREESRLLLANKLAEIFLDEGTGLSTREEELVHELIDQLLKNNNPTIRRELVKKFSEATRMPRKIALKLACETIDIARGILLSNENLTDEDLISVVRTQSHDHARVVATRRSISEAVADALVTTGDAAIMQIVAENLGARLSPQALGVIAEASRLTTNLQRPLLQRPELTLDMAKALYWSVAQELRRMVLNRFGMNAGQMELALVDTIDSKLQQLILQKHDDNAMRAVAGWLEDIGALSPRILPQLLRLGHFRLFNIVLGHLSALEPAAIDAIVSATGGRALAALCRALDIDKAGFVSIFLLSRGARPGEQIVHPRELSFALAAYDRFNPETARTMLQTWRENPEFLRRYENNRLEQEAS